MNGIHGVRALASGCIVLALCLAVSAIHAETLLVDSFSEVNAADSEKNWYVYRKKHKLPWDDTWPDPTGTEAFILGNARGILLEPIDPSPPPDTSVTASAAVGIDGGIAPEGALQVATQDGHSALVTLTYDGEGPAGLGGVDFTDGGTNDHFVFTFNWVAAVGSLDTRITVTDTEGGQVSRAHSFVDVANTTEFPVFFEDFGEDADTVFHDVDALEIVLNTEETPNIDFALESIQIVPEPGAWALLAVGLSALGLCRWGRRRHVEINA